MVQNIDTKQLFPLLVQQLESSGWMQLGVQPNPVTQRTEKNLQAAEMTIGILEALLFKTAGNLTKVEDQQLSKAVRELKATLIKIKQST